MIPQSFIQDLLNRVDIVDVVGRYVQLKKGGANFMGLCPFHNEKSPSFTVSPTKQFYHCFGCGAHGTAIGFLMEFSGMGFVEAVKDLAQGVGMAVPEQEDRRHLIAPPDEELIALRPKNPTHIKMLLDAAVLAGYDAKGMADKRSYKVPPKAQPRFADPDVPVLVIKPRPVVQRLYAAAVKAINAPEVRPRLAESSEVVGNTPEEFAACVMVANQYDLNPVVVKALPASVDQFIARKLFEQQLLLWPPWL